MSKLSHLLEDVNSTYNQLDLSDKADVEIALQAYRALTGSHPQKNICYLTMPVSTGKVRYKVLETLESRTIEELKEKFGDQAFKKLILEPNVQAGVDLAKRLQKKNPDYLYIVPGLFTGLKTPKKWTQEMYMSLWYRVMIEVADHHILANGWSYSVGSVKEVLFRLVVQNNLINANGPPGETVQNLLPDLSGDELARAFKKISRVGLYNHLGQQMELATILDKLVKSILNLKKRGFDSVELLELAEKISLIPDLSKRGFELRNKTFKTTVRKLQKIS